jgi:tRNA G10  N-methylase Trm11
MKHPAKYSNHFIPVLANLASKYNLHNIIDVFGGTGKIGLLKSLLPNLYITNNDIEPEWSQMGFENGCDECLTFDVANMSTIEDNKYDAIITSPTYGNGLAAKTMTGLRYNYSIFLGKVVNENNTGGMCFGKSYKQKHLDCITEMKRILKPSGILILNMKNFIRLGQEVPVVQWWFDSLVAGGFEMLEDIQIPVSSLRHGQNGNIRTKIEHVMVFKTNNSIVPALPRN